MPKYAEEILAADETQKAWEALSFLKKHYGSVSASKADVIVALGGASTHGTDLLFHKNG